MTGLNKYRFDSIPDHVFEEFRKETASIADFLRGEAGILEPASVVYHARAEDMNTMPEIFDEYQEPAEELTCGLLEQAEIGMEIADGREVTLEVTPEQWTLLNMAGMLRPSIHAGASRSHRASQYGPLNVDGCMYLMVPSGTVKIQVKAVESSDDGEPV